MRVTVSQIVGRKAECSQGQSLYSQTFATQALGMPIAYKHRVEDLVHSEQHGE